MKSSIWVTWQKEGIHCYPAAAKLQGVEFLQHPHRHMFHFKVKLEVFHDDRDVEFILLKRELENKFDVGDINYKSCEMLAYNVMDYIRTHYPNRNATVDVSEDGENGAELVYEEHD